VVYNNVIEYCSNHNLSIYAFEQKCGIGNGTVSKWKEKNFDPSIPTLQKIVNATGVPIAEWLKE
jgi:transcriptional regulator with XRE-family HTH domain